MIIIVVISGIVFSIFYFKKKSKKKLIEKARNIESKPNFKYPLPSVKDEIKEPIEICEEIINTLGRLRYKEYSLNYDPKNPLQPFYRFNQSPTLSSTASFSSSKPQSYIIPPQPSMIDPQFEKFSSPSINDNQSFTTNHYSLTDTESLAMGMSYNDNDSTPLLKTSNS
ncbi:hypothetical protein H8356DRAFT_1627738 [Neocallimastix lanati (nom. inval.)]|jgi:hypothetical protein|nr:hypothetical protein H8356DRAFT_1627738 [Neocallimastix sp. JGI-2020a]